MEGCTVLVNKSSLLSPPDLDAGAARELDTDQVVPIKYQEPFYHGITITMDILLVQNGRNNLQVPSFQAKTLDIRK